jgi:arylsulfatase
MTQNGSRDVLIALYLIPDLARRDFQSLVQLVDDYSVPTNGLVLVVRDAQGEVKVKETGDHAVRRGAGRGARIGLIAGLFAPLLIGMTVVTGAAMGALVGELVRRRVESGIADRMHDALPPGSASIVAVYEHPHADSVSRALTNAIRTSTAQIDEVSPMTLRSGLQKASAGLAG